MTHLTLEDGKEEKNTLHKHVGTAHTDSLITTNLNGKQVTL